MGSTVYVYVVPCFRLVRVFDETNLTSQTEVVNLGGSVRPEVSVILFEQDEPRGLTINPLCWQMDHSTGLHRCRVTRDGEYGRQVRRKQGFRRLSRQYCRW